MERDVRRMEGKTNRHGDPRLPKLSVAVLSMVGMVMQSWGKLPVAIYSCGVWSLGCLAPACLYVPDICHGNTTLHRHQRQGTEFQLLLSLGPFRTLTLTLT